MKRVKQPRALLRAVGIIASVAVVVSGVTFAALQSQNAILQGSTITSATANLTIGNSASNFAATMPGFNFANVEPGGQPVPATGIPVFLKNNGSSNLALRLEMNTSTFNNTQNADGDKIFIVLTSVSSGKTQEISLNTLLAAYANNRPYAIDETLPAGQVGQYTLQVAMATDAVSSTLNGVTLSGIDLLFSGNSVTS